MRALRKVTTSSDAGGFRSTSVTRVTTIERFLRKNGGHKVDNDCKERAWGEKLLYCLVFYFDFSHQKSIFHIRG
ncbi:MAG: hypothetical protein AYK19_16880 [Theionarchaea archaeon DG-70-1]|nr:MAG: hypothetical protein AYK19_16880 [Theionarchaea archaeon DG-70-1]